MPMKLSKCLQLVLQLLRFSTTVHIYECIRAVMMVNLCLNAFLF